MDGKRLSDRDKKTDYQDELDVYEAVWRMGKRIEKILRPEQLRLLLEAERIKWSDLSEVERQELGGEKEFDKDIGKTQEQRGQNEKRHEVSGVGLIVERLLMSAGEGVRSYFPKEEWEKFKPETKRKVAWEYFVHKYGVSPEGMKQILAEQYLGVKNE